jgi:hypothetical protein
MPRIALYALFALAGYASAAQDVADYAREERWAQEIVPSLVVGDPCILATPTRQRVLAILTMPTGAAAGGVVVVHGLGVHPDWGLNGGLRAGLADAGYVTLSVQMPVLAATATRDEYVPALPEAAERVAAAVDLSSRKGVRKIAIVSHSLGASMANTFPRATAGAPTIDAWAPVGMAGAFAVAPNEPVLDVLAEREIDLVRTSARARIATLPKDRCSRQIVIAGADHNFRTGRKSSSRRSRRSRRVFGALASALRPQCARNTNYEHHHNRVCRFPSARNRDQSGANRLHALDQNRWPLVPGSNSGVASARRSSRPPTSDVDSGGSTTPSDRYRREREAALGDDARDLDRRRGDRGHDHRHDRR